MSTNNLENIPVSIKLNDALRVLGWGRSKFFERLAQDANLRAVSYRDGLRTTGYTFFLHELLMYKARFRVGGPK